jgi:hypothetical protein
MIKTEGGGRHAAGGSYESGKWKERPAAGGWRRAVWGSEFGVQG